MTLKGFSSVFDATLSNDIQDCVVEYFDWELLNKGNYFNVTLGETINGQDYSVLKPSTNESFAIGRAWEGFRKNWIWQSGIVPIPGRDAPIVGINHSKPGISGVYVNNTFYPSNTSGVYAHYVDYTNGRVVFNNPIPTGSKVQAEYSYKWITLDYSNDVPWIRDIQTQTLTPGEFLNNKDQWNLPANLRVQLPNIIVELFPSRSFKGYQLGGGQWVKTDVMFYCLAEDEDTRNKLVDIVSLQNDGVFCLFNSNQIYQNNDFPIDYRGCPVSGAKTYLQLINLYNAGSARFINTTISDLTFYNSSIFGGIVRSTVEVIRTNI